MLVFGVNLEVSFYLLNFSGLFLYIYNFKNANFSVFLCRVFCGYSRYGTNTSRRHLLKSTRNDKSLLHRIKKRYFRLL